MGEIADWMIDQALGFHDDYDGYDGYGGYRKQSDPAEFERRTKQRLANRYWVDAKGRKLYPSKTERNGGMTLGHIQSVKAKLQEAFQHRDEMLKESILWRALCDGERTHEQELRKSKDINEGVIKW